MALTLALDVLLENGPLRLKAEGLTKERYFAFCQQHTSLRIERSAEGEVIVMAPSSSEAGRRNSEISRQLGNWNIECGEPGYVFDSSAGFSLPNAAERSPDASWIEKSCYDALPEFSRERFADICPDFVIEVMSTTERMWNLQAKMDEYIANGAQLGWLIDPRNKRIFVYRPAQPVQEINNPESISGDPELPGFVLSLVRIF